MVDQFKGSCHPDLPARARIEQQLKAIPHVIGLRALSLRSLRQESANNAARAAASSSIL
jgi:hypothetical protein